MIILLLLLLLLLLLSLSSLHKPVPKGPRRAEDRGLEYPQYFLFILHGEMTVFADLRHSTQSVHTHSADKCQNPGSQNSLMVATVGFHK